MKGDKSVIQHLNKILAKATGQPLAKVEKDVDRDYFRAFSRK